MSRIGKKPIQIPSGVTVNLAGNTVHIQGPKGELSFSFNPVLAVDINDGVLSVKAVVKGKKTPALWGLTRACLQNMVEGVTRGYEKRLEIEGIGFKAIAEGVNLQLSLGFSHPIKFPAPPNIQLRVEKNIIIVSGIDKALVGETAARLRSLKKPEPYKGKGIHYLGEVIRRKQGKKAVASGS